MTAYRIALTVLVLFTLPSILIRRRGRPVAAIGWILGLLALPTLTLFFWWTVGRQRMERRKRRRRLYSKKAMSRLGALTSKLSTAPEAEPSLLPVKHLPAQEAFGVFRPTSGNHIVALNSATDLFEQVAAEIAKAKHHLHLLFYTWKKDQTGEMMRDLLVQKAREGVEVRLLCDGLGSPAIRSRKFMKPLRQAGGKVVAFLPPTKNIQNLTLNFRNHRKIIVIDGKKAFIGGFNIGNEYHQGWRDSAVGLEGPVLDQIQEVFADDWYFSTGEDLSRSEYFGQWKEAGNDSCAVIASGPHADVNYTHLAFFAAINEAKERIWITTPYFIPDEPILVALRSAEYRGVDVRILLPLHCDIPLVRWASRSFYPELLEAGVRIFEYEKSVLHAKTMILDRNRALIGSANVDVRSFRWNFEISCFIGSRDLNESLSQHFLQDLQSSREILKEEIEKASYVRKVTEAAAHLLTPVL